MSAVQLAIDKGLFRKSPSPQAEPCMRTILQVALQIAEGLAFLHSRCVVHCDFSGSTLLTSMHDSPLPSLADWQKLDSSLVPCRLIPKQPFMSAHSVACDLSIF